MSFCQQQKDAILTEQIRSSCCLKALFEGVLCARGYVGSDRVHLTVSKELAPYLQTYCSDIYSTNLDAVERKNGGRQIELSLRSSSARRFLERLNANGVIEPTEKCPLCFSYFLKGIFLVCAAMSDPAIEFRLELKPIQEEARVRMLYELLSSRGIEMKIATRSGQAFLYTKKSALLEDFFAMANMNQVTFALMNLKIENEIRNNANRISNCEMSNIEKAVTASNRHLSAIEELSAAGLLSSLPEELEETARLRLSYPDLSVSQLASLMTPAITKSGLTHRLNKIMKIASELLQLH